MTSKRLIIFDYDGTLADTSPGIRYCYNATADAMGYVPHLAREDFFGVIGGSLEDGFHKLWPQMTPEEISRAVVQYRERYASEGRKLPAPLYDGMRETLMVLKKLQFRLAVATLKHERFIHGMLEDNDIDGLFDAVCAYTGSETKSGLLRKACTLTEVSPEESLLVGDSAYDGKGAREVPMDFAAVLYGWGFRQKEETAPYAPVMVLNRPAELLAALK
ncbi:MAG TPA: HAD hydrolase-like protein [Firmicutes bacterium]|nr:HAD hydrolase-like protein [Bacillota bacterium]